MPVPWSFLTKPFGMTHPGLFWIAIRQGFGIVERSVAAA